MRSPSSNTESDRDRALELLIALAHPLSPFESLESRDAAAKNATAGRPAWLLDGVLLVLTERPPLPHPVTWADADVSALEILAAYSGEPGLVDRLAALLDDPQTREIAIDALGQTGDPEAVGRLLDAGRRYELTESELTSLASALGDLGGADGRAALMEMQCSSNLPDAVRTEIALALDRSGA